MQTILEKISTLTILFLVAAFFSFANAESFDHFSTGFPLTGAHQRLDCESCHTRGVFTGTPTRCASCHSETSRLGGERKPPNHIPTSNTCEDCHVTSNWKQIASFEHGDVTGACSFCHNGQTAVGKSPNHVASSNNCDDCHRTTSWAGAVFDHTNITGNCASCHNGTTAITRTNLGTGRNQYRSDANTRRHL